MNDETRADVSQLSDAIKDMNSHLQEINFSEIERGYWGFSLSVDSLLAICNRHQSRITELEPRSCVQAGIQYVHKEVERLVAELIELDGKIKAAKDPVSASAFEDGERLWRTDSLLRIMDRAERDIVSAIYAVLSLEQAKEEAMMTELHTVETTEAKPKRPTKRGGYGLSHDEGPQRLRVTAGKHAGL
ncbi:MAG TPA: hypothetical protein VGP76_24505 [Planctomycetaceae bacterium]|jgi:hypothetical protein|nr:hypothetical protein [Planctomycetaceae bacterium]